jgi:hypothetical protein
MRGLWLLLVVLVCLFAALAAGWLAAWRAFGQTGLWLGLAGYGLAWFVAEVALGIIFYTYGTLALTAQRASLSSSS